jgi:hypothetical protein
MIDRIMGFFLPKEPFNRCFGLNAGQSIDRHFIEKFLAENSADIKGIVLEISERTYTQKFGKHVTKSLVFSHVAGEGVDITGDLEKEFPPQAALDCFIMTQTLPFVFDVGSALKNSFGMLAEGGVLLVTVPGITQISRYDYDRWGQYWSFTKQSLSMLVAQNCIDAELKIASYGNAKLAASFLYGVPIEKLSKDTISFNDPDYEMLIVARIRKKIK